MLYIKVNTREVPEEYRVLYVNNQSRKGSFDKVNIRMKGPGCLQSCPFSVTSHCS